MKTLIVMLLILGLSFPAFASEWEKIENNAYRKATYKGWIVDYGNGPFYIPDENHEWRIDQ